ncbi:hypothetical protein LTR84_004240 [Exophiala bonariae]|uniref:6-phosphofructo-2-kinase domain-containing protein n=1 Tax=Exophiala bonariae TaxID=1690606 RepID=A0AAV9N736_9EURO|nr:hypothetical protein LTR84_004240 [Exophiala bonariae]
MVGLPARGKSYISKKLARYLYWLQFETRVFNAGQTRRRALAPQKGVYPSSDVSLSHPASFFDPDDMDAVKRRENIALQTLEDLLVWLNDESSSVGILDATNSTVQRRLAVLDKIRKTAHPCTELLFLESCCYDWSLLERNIRLKLSGPDYSQQNEESALNDFRKRIVLYEKNYVSMNESAEEEETPYLQLHDVGRRVIANRINGFLSAQATEYLLNFRLHQRQIWITRNGESIDDADGKIGRSSSLSLRGTKFAHALSVFIKQQQQIWEEVKTYNKSRVKAGENKEILTSQEDITRSNFQVWTSIMVQAVETSKFFPEDEYLIRKFRTLNDLHAGQMEGLTFSEILDSHEDQMNLRRQDPVHYRWPGTGGESYADVIHRLRPIIMELERLDDHVLLITHRAVARVLLAYFKELDWDRIADVEVPPGRVFCVEPVSAAELSDEIS